MEKNRYVYLLVNWLLISLVYLITINFIGLNNQEIFFFYCMYFGAMAMGHYFQIRQILIWTEIKDLLISSFTYVFFSSLAIFTFYGEWIYLLSYNVMITIFMFLFTLVVERYAHVWFRKQLVRKTLIIGTGEEALHLAYLSRTNRFALIDVVGFVEFFSSGVLKLDEYNVYSINELSNLIQKYHVTQVIVAEPDIDSKQLLGVMKDLMTMVNYVKYVPRTNGMMNYDSEIQDFDGVLLISTVRKKMRFFSKLLKRIIDIIGGMIGIILLIPLTVYVKIKYILCGDKNSIFFKQERIGKKGKPIYIYKFRSMVPNAEELLEKMMEDDPAIKEEYLKNKKLENDPRITPFGEFLRKTSMDEFPQMINVLKGEMSLVGPRPYLFREKMDMDFYENIIQCKPGLTGMWQVSGRNNISFKDRCSLDEYYYLNWNLWLDLTILVKTVKPVLARDGSM